MNRKGGISVRYAAFYWISEEAKRGKIMKKKLTYIIHLLLLLLCFAAGCNTVEDPEVKPDSGGSEVSSEPPGAIEESGEYITKEEVAAYLQQFGHLPDNFITKEEARALGWVSKEKNLNDVAPGKCIGGDHFGNYEGMLPAKEGRQYTECDINSVGGNRGPERIVYSNDGLIYYTSDHYESFELLFGEE